MKFRSQVDALGELDPATRVRVRVGTLLAAALAAVLVLAPVLLPPILTHRDQPGRRSPDLGLPVSQPLFDFFQRASHKTIGPEVVVVEIDERSLAVFGGWPWSRFDMAAIVKRILAQEPAALGFDLIFAEPDRMTPERIVQNYDQTNELSPDVIRAIEGLRSTPDRELGRALGQDGAMTVLARAGVGVERPPPQPPPAVIVGMPPRTVADFPFSDQNILQLEGRALGVGLVNSYPDRDGVVRNIPVIGRASGYLTPSLALEMVRVASHAGSIQLIGDSHALRAVKVGDHRVTTTPDGQLRLRFREVPRRQVISATQIAAGNLPPDQFKGKLVLVGLTSAGLIDVVATPRLSQTYGVYVQAQAIDAILHGRAIARPPWATWAEWIAGVSLAIIVTLYLPGFRLLTIVGFALLTTAIALGGSWLAFERGLMLDPAPVLAPGIAAAVTMIALLFVEGGQVRARLRTVLAQEQSERDTASKIQAGMLIPRGQLQSISPEVDIDAILLPARTVGGDLYDVFTLPGDRLCFVVGDVTGKGLPASLFMALGKAMSRGLLIQPHLDLAQAMTAINTELSASNGQKLLLSMLVGILHPDGSLEMCSAGHEDPFVIDRAGDVRVLRLVGGPPLCARRGFSYPRERFRLEPGETLVAFTDGMTEAHDREHRLFGSARAAAAAAAGAALPIGDLVDKLVASVRAFEAGKEPSDDLTILALRRRG